MREECGGGQEASHKNVWGQDNEPAGPEIYIGDLWLAEMSGVNLGNGSPSLFATLS